METKPEKSHAMQKGQMMIAHTKQHKAESCGPKLESLRRAHNVADGSKITQFMKENEFFFSLSDVMLGIISDSMTHANLIVAI